MDARIYLGNLTAAFLSTENKTKHFVSNFIKYGLLNMVCNYIKMPMKYFMIVSHGTLYRSVSDQTLLYTCLQ